MDEKKRYENYRHMFNNAQELTIKIQSNLIHKYSMTSVFVSVGDEEKGLYFIDVEAGGSKETYFHYRGMLTEKQVFAKFC